jgi:Zn-dependent oligopeptidase
LKEVSDKADVREAARKFEKELVDYQTELWMRDDVYKMFKDYVVLAKKDKSFDKIDKEAQRYVTKTLEDFET